MEKDSSAEKLLHSAIKLFARQSFDQTSVKQIADDAGVNVSLVSYHFNGKEGLYRACFDKFEYKKFSNALRIITRVASPEELKIRLCLFVEEFWRAQIEESEMMKILHREKAGLAIARDCHTRIFVEPQSIFLDLFRDAQQKGFLRKDWTPALLAEVFFGCAIQLTSTFQEDADRRKMLANTWISLLLEGAQTK